VRVTTSRRREKNEIVLRFTIRIPCADLENEFDVKLLKTLPITARQREVLAGVYGDLQNKTIADRLNITTRTVKFHIARLLRRYHVQTRQQLKACAMLESTRVEGQIQ
jgi:DNA-binding CsgD family transcriptional regulator